MEKVRSIIKPVLKRRKLWLGSLLSFSGSIILIFSALFLSPSFLTYWGIPIFCIGIGLIALGLIPYKTLTKLELHPHEIHYDEDMMIFFLNGKKAFFLPRVNIDRIENIEDPIEYGLKIYLKHPMPEKIGLFDPHFNLQKFQRNSRRLHQCDLWFPYLAFSVQLCA